MVIENYVLMAHVNLNKVMGINGRMGTLMDNDFNAEHGTQGKSNFDELTKDIMSYLRANPEDQYIHLNMINGKTERADTPPPRNAPPKPDAVRQFTPQDVKTYLDKHVVKQDDAKKSLAIAICEHINHVMQSENDNSPYVKQNVLLIGPTGVGKTFLVKLIAEFIGVPFVKSDATKFTETGYQGGDVEDLVRQLAQKAGDDVSLAEKGIIFLDEIDKISGSQDRRQKDVSGLGVQRNLLKIMEETEVQLRPAWDMQAQMMMEFGRKKDAPETINTKNILFIMSGAFVGLDEIIRQRVEGSSMGFDRNQDKKSNDDLMVEVCTNDLISFGLEHEFVGRLPVRTSCKELNAEDLYHVLVDSESSLLYQTKRYFKNYGIKVAFTEDVLRELSRRAYEEKTGARGLGTVFETTFRDYKFELPSSSVKRFVVEMPMLSKGRAALDSLLAYPEEAHNHYDATLNSRMENLFSTEIVDQMIDTKPRWAN